MAEWLYGLLGSHLEFFDPCQWFKRFIKSKTYARQMTTWSKKLIRLELSDSLNVWMMKNICFASSQTISNNLSNDRGYFVFINSPVQRIGSILGDNGSNGARHSTLIDDWRFFWVKSPILCYGYYIFYNFSPLFRIIEDF